MAEWNTSCPGQWHHVAYQSREANDWIRFLTLREHLVKMLAASIWREHPEVKTIRAIFGSIRLPSVHEFEEGKRESYQFLYAYDFSLQNEAAKPNDR